MVIENRFFDWFEINEMKPTIQSIGFVKENNKNVIDITEMFEM